MSTTLRALVGMMSLLRLILLQIANSSDIPCVSAILLVVMVWVRLSSMDVESPLLKKWSPTQLSLATAACGLTVTTLFVRMFSVSALLPAEMPLLSKILTPPLIRLIPLLVIRVEGLVPRIMFAQAWLLCARMA